MTHDIRKFMKLMEQAPATLMEFDLKPAPDAEHIPVSTLGRDEFGRATHPGITMTPSKGKVTATLTSYNSQSYTKLAQKVERMKALSAEVKQLTEEIKQETREDIADLFSADDIVHTRVVETVSFIMSLSKDPSATETYKYAEVLKELTEHLTPELIVRLTDIKAKFKSTVNKAPSLTITAKESVMEGVWAKMKGFFARYKQAIMGWADSYDAKFDAVKAMINSPVAEDAMGGDDFVEEGIVGGDPNEGKCDYPTNYHFAQNDSEPFLLVAYDENYGAFDPDKADFSANEATLEDAIFGADNTSAFRVEVYDTRNGHLVYQGQEPDEDMDESAMMEGDREVQSLEGFDVGDMIQYTATAESPPAVYAGKIAKLYDTGVPGHNEAWIEWTDRGPKTGGGRVSLHDCRTAANSHAIASMNQESVMEGDSEVQSLEGYDVGDIIQYTATEESPPAVYRGKIEKLYDTGSPGHNEAWVEWSGSRPKKVGGRVSLHQCRSLANTNAGQPAQEAPVAETVDYSRVDRIEKQVEHMVRAGRTRQYIIANIGEKMGTEEADYAGDYFDEFHKDHVGSDVTAESVAPKKSNMNSSLYGHQYIKEDDDGDDMGGDDEGGDDEFSESDIATPESQMMAEFQSEMNSEPMAYSTGDTVYCGGRAGNIVSTVPGKPDTWLVELPNGQHDAFPKATTTAKKPSFFKKAFYSVVGEGLNEGFNDMIGKTPLQTTKAMKEMGYSRQRPPGGSKNELVYTKTGTHRGTVIFQVQGGLVARRA